MKKLDSNGLWQSKFIMPEFKEAILQQQLENMRNPRPQLDEQEKGIINSALAQSASQKSVVVLKLYDPFEPRKVSGVASKYDQKLRQVRIECNNEEFEWVSVVDILSAEVQDDFNYDFA